MANSEAVLCEMVALEIRIGRLEKHSKDLQESIGL